MISFAGRTVGLGSIFTHPLLAVYITETYWFVPLASSSGKWRFIGITDPKNAKILVVTSQHHHGKGCPTQVIYQVHVVLLDVCMGYLPFWTTGLSHGFPADLRDIATQDVRSRSGPGIQRFNAYTILFFIHPVYIYICFKKQIKKQRNFLNRYSL